MSIGTSISCCEGAHGRTPTYKRNRQIAITRKTSEAKLKGHGRKSLIFFTNKKTHVWIHANIHEKWQNQNSEEQNMGQS